MDLQLTGSEFPRNFAARVAGLTIKSTSFVPSSSGNSAIRFELSNGTTLDICVFNATPGFFVTLSR